MSSTPQPASASTRIRGVKHHLVRKNASIAPLLNTSKGGSLRQISSRRKTITCTRSFAAKMLPCRAAPPRWEQGCPLQIQVLQISRDTESSELFLQARIRNISDRDIAACKLEAEIKHDDNAKNTFVIEMLDADLPAGKARDLSPRPVGKGSVSDAGLVALSVQQGDATWQSCARPAELPQRTLLELPKELRSIRGEALRKAGGNQVNKVLDGAVRDEDNFWVCACGQVNIGRRTCCSCSSAKETLESLESPDKLRELGAAQQRRAARSKRVVLIAAACVVAAVAGGLLVTRLVIPQIRYFQAHSAVDNGDYGQGESRSFVSSETTLTQQARPRSPSGVSESSSSKMPWRPSTGATTSMLSSSWLTSRPRTRQTRRCTPTPLATSTMTTS